jgi:hypothetical protein
MGWAGVGPGQVCSAAVANVLGRMAGLEKITVEVDASEPGAGMCAALAAVGHLPLPSRPIELSVEVSTAVVAAAALAAPELQALCARAVSLRLEVKGADGGGGGGGGSCAAERRRQEAHYVALDKALAAWLPTWAQLQRLYVLTHVPPRRRASIQQSPALLPRAVAICRATGWTMGVGVHCLTLLNMGMIFMRRPDCNGPEHDRESTAARRPIC